ncbi:MAG: hypothetical protein ABIT08_00650 [Bacteroidia bacterium]
MDNESIKRDDLTRNIIQKAGMEQPSFLFTSKIMEQIRLSRSPEVFIYQPVIAKKTWFAIGMAIVAVVLLFMSMPASNGHSGNGFMNFLTPAQNVMDTAATGFFAKLSFLNSLSWIAVALIAGWLLLAADKILRSAKGI